MSNELTPGQPPSRYVVGEPDSSGTTVTISEAARRSGLSVSTLRRRLAKGTIPGAYKAPGPDGEEWRIPVAALDEAPVVRPVDLVDDLRRELDDTRARLAVAEALAAERERTLDTLAVTVEALREGMEALRLALPAPAPVVPVEEPRRWFRRSKPVNVPSTTP